MPYNSGDTVTVDGIDYTIGDAAEAYTVTDPDGVESVLTLAQIEAGQEDASEPAEDAPMPAVGSPEFKKMKAKLKASAGF